MGVVRLVLALGVVLAHNSAVLGNHPLGERTAVGCFFVISASTWRSSWTEIRPGYLRRLADAHGHQAGRLAPVYLAVLAATAAGIAQEVAIGGSSDVLGSFSQLEPFAAVALTLSAAALAASVALALVVDRPVEKWRQRRLTVVLERDQSKASRAVHARVPEVQRQA